MELAGARVDVSTAGGDVVVRDHGPGIPTADAEHVFDRFWRSSAARSMPGSGLGLAIVREVAERHGGSVRLEHPAAGGALFRLRLAPDGSAGRTKRAGTFFADP